ncbi:MAG: SCO1664 family protein [Candidatus Rokuibacteriota bacterium]
MGEPKPKARRADTKEGLRLLREGDITVKGRMPRSSNATFLVELALNGATTLAVYKPERGERPLWDFPPGLHRREIAAYLLSEALGWGLVPPTAPRDGPLGEGSLQLFVPADFRQHYFTLLEAVEHRERLQQICLFDLVANNADRKSGHCLLVPDDRIYAIDNGLTFHAEPKLRTVIWDFGEEPIVPARLEDLRRVVSDDLPSPLAELLDADEQRALKRRARGLLRSGHFPVDESGLRYPWPLI